MLDTLTSAAFAARIGKLVTVETAEGDLTVEILGVSENPKATGPDAQRTPFSVMLRGPDSPCLADGCFNLRADDGEGWRLDAIYLNRIIPAANTDGKGAFYQVIFG